ncbi:MAG: hypothetical protein KJO21_05600 [Verrucomicrobiae bacterium]|nr:hypothetical protein [Verrucomicrobiae bacterium]NNJ43197.1 hypothetical protein [Akkermansiaceae bacterium]
MKEFSHIGIPTTVARENEIYLEDAKLYVTDFNENDNSIEWLRFENDSPLPEPLKTTAHVAYKVDDLEKFMATGETLVEPFSPMDGLLVGFILNDGAPVEFMQEI